MRSGGRFRGKISGGSSGGNALNAADNGGDDGGVKIDEQGRRYRDIKRDAVDLQAARQVLQDVEMGYRAPEVSQALRELVQEHADAVTGAEMRKRELEEFEDEGYVSAVEHWKRGLEDEEDEGYVSGDDSDGDGDEGFRAGFEYGLHMARAFM